MNDTAAFITRVEEHTGKPGRKVGRETRLVCPAHDDHDPSLNVAEGANGQPLVQCRSGQCTWEQICEKIGWERARGSGPLIVEEYDYTDEHGTLLSQAVRLAPKDFRQRRPDGNGGWTWKLGDVRRVLYRLPNVRAAAEKRGLVFFVEGEKDVHALEKLGLVATTNAMGAGKWRDEYAGQLDGARVAIVPDDDDTGRTHARQVADSLTRAGITNCIAPVWPEGETKRDISDYLADVRTDEQRSVMRQQLLDMVEAFFAEKVADANEPPAGPPRRFPGLTHAQALARVVPETQAIIKDTIEAGTVGTIAGLPETHKSFLAVEIAHKVAAGGTVLGRFPVVETGPVAYWWQDDSEANELIRMQKYATRNGYTGDLPITWHLNEGLKLPDDLDALRDEVERLEQKLVVLDSLYNFLPAGVDLKDTDVAGVLAALKEQVCNPTGCAILIVDHAPWPTDSNRGQRRAFGSVFKAAAIRWSIFLEREGDTLWFQSHGNNLPTTSRTIAAWDEDRLELRLVDPLPAATGHAKADDLLRRVLEYVEKHPGRTTTAITNDVQGRAESIRQTLQKAENAGRVTKRAVRPDGRVGTGDYWYPLNDAGLGAVPTLGTGWNVLPSGVSQTETRPNPSATRRGDGLDGTGVTETDPRTRKPQFVDLFTHQFTNNDGGTIIAITDPPIYTGGSAT